MLKVIVGEVENGGLLRYELELEGPAVVAVLLIWRVVVMACVGEVKEMSWFSKFDSRDA